MKDIFTYETQNNYSYKGFVDEAFRFIEDFQLMRPDVWARFVQQFREFSDWDGGWRGEFWGKMMRGACMTYAYTKNEELYKILVDTIRDMMSTADENGRISAYPVSNEFDAWDIWCRKYVMLGMEYFLEICKDEALKEEIIASMRGQADYFLSKIGGKPGYTHPVKGNVTENPQKICIANATRHWRGLNSCSYLEPIVRLYKITGEQRYFDFATEIVEMGFTDVTSFIKLAYENKLAPYQYPITKAYEMTSCFEGLMEYYKIDGNEMHKTAIINFANRILECDFTVVGSSGCTHELFDHSTVRQANTTNHPKAQETCVTVTLMKFLYRVHLLTGDPKYIDAVEKSFYNAYLGAVNTDKVVEPMVKNDHPDWVAEPLPFDSYSPLTAGVRGVGIGGLKIMSDKHYYGCCACIGAAGIGILPHVQLLKSESGIVLNLYINGSAKTTTPSGKTVVLDVETKYPVDGKVSVKIGLDAPEKFEIKLRNPEWNKNTSVSVNGKPVEITEGYITIDKNWENGDVIEFNIDMTTYAVYPIPYGSEMLMNEVIWGRNYMIPTMDIEDPKAKNHIALQRGPVMLAQENRLGYNVDDAADFAVNADGSVDLYETEFNVPYKHLMAFDVKLTDGSRMTLTDYASAGKLWTEESKMAVWFITK